MDEENSVYMQLILGRYLLKSFNRINDNTNLANTVVQKVIIDGESYTITLKKE
ncbi:hypothetical protein [Leuconostoc gasicomitatum]|uniref:hypothetical protein n=1 Tax=Leuconostoc gasicomitatum TaxID=115778 RepID=UPI001CC7387F|nr:hypothetical protein [Leuconostoc gasicomitatum]MBZ5980060.1 hypothetical protein [Leuconostoc gasicomitatum]